MTDRSAHDRDTGRDPYSTLGVGADATDEEITRAYRRLARARHPDANPDATHGDFPGLTDAYDVLRDPDRRRRYDRTRDTRTAAARDAAATRIPVRNAATRRSQPTSGASPSTARTAEVDLTLTFDQAALGTIATVTLTADGICPACGGHGVAAARSACPDCDGRGGTTRVSGGITIRTACPSCEGTGHGRPASCAACSGSGTTSTRREVTVRVPAGVEDGTRLRLRPGTDAPGAVTAIVRVAPHRFFERRGLDVAVRVPVTFAEAALGAVVTVPTLDGAVAIRVPAGSPHGRVLRVAGRGIPHSSQLGDLLVTVAVDVPTALNDHQRAALEAFAAATASPRGHFEGSPPSATGADHARRRRRGEP